ncbi:Exo-glucosaminidase LytG [Lactococcus lactis]|nr:Exo-glucosaminidase LytG [Lactococcus lactis]
MKYKTRRRKPNRRQSLLKQLIFIFLVILGILVYNRNFNNQVEKPSEAQLQEINEHKFIKEIAPLAQKSQKESQVLASITIAQACLESNFGKSELASKYHNLFGVKASGDVPKVSLETQEYENGQWITIQGVFRVYPNFADSVSAHTQLFLYGTTWNSKQYASVLSATDYKTAAKAVQNSGYATDPTYADKLINMIETYHLNQYDKSSSI